VHSAPVFMRRGFAAKYLIVLACFDQAQKKASIKMRVYESRTVGEKVDSAEVAICLIFISFL
jgi:hypothetical protein